MATPYISMAGIGKSFGPVHALKSVNLTVYPGEIHALLGENGAGKSTLMKVLSGIHEPTKGTITINNISYNRNIHCNTCFSYTSIQSCSRIIYS